MHHQLIGISDLIHLTTRELRELDARLRHILERDPSLTDRDIGVILGSLANVSIAIQIKFVSCSVRID